MLAQEHWGKGYATEISLRLLQAAFLELRAELDRLIAERTASAKPPAPTR